MNEDRTFLYGAIIVATIEIVLIGTFVWGFSTIMEKFVKPSQGYQHLGNLLVKTRREFSNNLEDWLWPNE